MKEWFGKHFKGLNIVAFIFSCFFVVYGLINISSVPWIQWVMGGLGLYVEWEAQHVWGLSFSWQKAGRGSYVWLKGIYIAYIIIFALLSGIGFFATEINMQEAVSQKIETIENNNQRRIDQIYAMIDNLNAQLAKEGNTGIGTKYEGLQTKIDSYNDELKTLMNQSKTDIKVETKAQAKDMFANISKVLWDIPKNVLILTMFGFALVMVYLGLMLKPMTVEVEAKTVTTLPQIDTPKIVLSEPVTDDPKPDTRTCPNCGDEFSGRYGKIFCSENCRITAFRKNNRR
jgi:hypothetical protein